MWWLFPVYRLIQTYLLDQTFLVFFSAVFTARRYFVSAVFAVVRCPFSVRPSVTLVHCIHYPDGWRYQLLSRPGSPIILVFLTPAPVPNSKGPIQRGAKYRGGAKNLRFLTEIAIYLGNGKSCYGWLLYGTLIGNHRLRIDRCQDRWPWVTHNPGFKVTEYLKVEYLKNGASDGQSYTIEH